MNYSKRRFICSTCFGALALFCINPSYAAETLKKEKPPVKLTTELKGQMTSENDMDLDTADEGGTDSRLLELKSKIEGKAGDHISFLLEGRWVESYGAGGSFDVDTGETTGHEDFLEVRQYWLGYDDLFGTQGLTLRAGRQRIREDYGFWWNRDLDSIRLIYASEGLDGFFGVGQNMAEYRTSGDTFNQDDEEILRVMGELSKEWSSAHFIDGRVLYQEDHSGIESVDDIVRDKDYDSADADLLWMGLRLHGSVLAGQEAEEDKDKDKDIRKSSPSYRLDLAMVTGEEDNLSTSSVNSSGFRTVTGSSDEDILGWAVDAGIDIPVSVLNNSIIHAGYAYGSGDDDTTDGTNNNFRQTGLDGNSSKLGDFSSSVNNYGSVLKPDLANLHIATLGVTVPLGEAADLAGFYRYYLLADEDGGLTSSVSASLNGEDTSVGHGLDLILNMNISKQFGIDKELLNRVNFKTTIGAFHAGDAYGDAEGETAFRGQFDLGIRF